MLKKKVSKACPVLRPLRYSDGEGPLVVGGGQQNFDFRERENFMLRLRNLISRFHNDRRGSNSLEQIVIFALGVLVLGGVWYVWKEMPVGGQAAEGNGLMGMIQDALGSLFKLDFFKGEKGA